jgi:hypothetical protein
MPLPPDLQDEPFDRAALDRARLSQGRAGRKDIVRPYRGVQSTTSPSTVQERCRAYAVRLRPGQFFSHVTAAMLHELPLPRRLEAEALLHVACVRPQMPPRAEGVAGHRLSRAPLVEPIDGLPACVATEAWCQVAPLLTLDEAVIIADALLQGAPVDEEAARAVLRHRIGETRREGCGLLLASLDEARAGSRSPGETRVRLLLVRAGLPQPALNDEIRDAHGRFLGTADLVWRDQRVLLEYEGDLHRTDLEQFRYDIERYERFTDAGWAVVRVTGDDLRGGRRDALVARVARRLGVSLPETTSGRSSRRQRRSEASRTAT